MLLRVSHFSDIKIQPEYVLAGLHLEIDRGGGEISICKKEGGGGGGEFCVHLHKHMYTRGVWGQILDWTG